MASQDYYNLNKITFATKYEFLLFNLIIKLATHWKTENNSVEALKLEVSFQFFKKENH